MEYKKGAPVESMLHESGDDIFISYRTGRKAIIKGGKIDEVIEAGKNYQKIAWKRDEWEKEEAAEKEAKEEAAAKEDQKKEQIEATERDQKQLASVSNEKE